MLNTPLKILVVEDDHGDFILVKEYIEESFSKASIFHALALKEGINILEKERIDVVLLDLTLPDGMGLQSFHLVKLKAPQVPVIILTGLKDTETALESLHVGAQDYIIKDDCSSPVLAKSIWCGMGRKKNETEKELLIEELTKNNSDLQQFSYITSHNLRSPLSNLLGILKMLDLSSITDPMNKLLLENFEECTVQLNDTVNDLTNVLIIKNNVNAKKEILDIRKTFNRVVHSIQNTIDKNNVTITTDFDSAFEVQFNHAYLESILLNLITNAIKYSSPNRIPEIKIRTVKTKDIGVQLYFQDNGLGIDLKRHRDRIFGLYQKFHDHPDSKGLGLYIVNSQVRVMGGEIDVESEVDKGTTFIITFKTDFD